MMNKSALVLTASMILGLGIVTTTTTSQAASWHQGTPTILRGKWRTKALHKSGYPFTRRGYIILKKQSFVWQEAFIPDPGGGAQVKYKRLSRGNYVLHSRDYGNEPTGGVIVGYDVRLHNRHQLQIKESKKNWSNQIYYKY